MNGNPYRQFADMILGESKRHTSSLLNGNVLELGTITESGLKLDSFKHEIQDYFVADFSGSLHLPDETLEDVKMELRSGFHPGSRVLCVPINGGHDVVILCKIVR